MLYCALSLLFAVNFLICYWEICLFRHRDYVESRVGYWLARNAETGGSPVVDFLTTRVALGKAFSPTIWADVWAAYARYDSSYADRRAYGFNIDVANGFFVPIPSLVLYAALTVPFLPAMIAGILGVMLFWQWVYTTSVYWLSFFVSGRQKPLTGKEMAIYVWGGSSPWVICSLVGLYVSLRLIADGDYGVLGH